MFLFATLKGIESFCLSFKQDKLQYTTDNYFLLSVCVCVSHMLLAGVTVEGCCSSGRRRCNVGRSCFTAGLPLWRTSHKLNTEFLFKTVHFLGVRGLTASSYILHDYTILFLLLQSALQPLWVLACSTTVEYSEQEGFYRVPLPAACQTPTWRTSDLEHSNSHHKESPASETIQANPSSRRWNCGREIAENFAESGDFHVTFGFFYMP